MAHEGPVVEDEVLEPAALDGHDHGFMGRVERRDDPLGPALETQAPGPANPDANAAAQAHRRVDLGPLLACVGRVVGRDHGHGLDRTGGDAIAAPRARGGLDHGQEIRRVDGMEEPEAPLGDHGLAAAATAIADEADPPADVLAELDEIAAPGLVEQGQALGHVDGPGVAVPDEGRRGVVEGHADVEGRVAGAARVLHLVPAVAEADTAVGRGLDDLAGPLVVEDVQGVLFRQDSLVDEGPPEVGLAMGEEGLDEVLLDRDVLIIELRQGLLVDVPPEAHERELEEPGHGRRQDVGRSLGALDVDEQGPGGQGIEGLAGVGLAHTPAAGGLGRRERLDGDQGHERGFLLAHEHLEDGEEEVGGGRALGKAVQTLDEGGIAGPGGEMMGHGPLLPDFGSGGNPSPPLPGSGGWSMLSTERRHP